MRIEIDIAEHHYNNIMALDSVSLGRVPYKGIIMYSINAIKHGRVLEQEPTTENDLEVQKAIEIIKADSLAPYSVDDILKARDLAVEALKQMKTAKNSLSAEEVTAFAEWTAKLTKASEEAYRRGYLDCSEKLRSFQKLHDEERELKDKLNKIDIEDAWKCGFEQGVKYEKLGRTDICPHCGEYIGEEE